MVVELLAGKKKSYLNKLELTLAVFEHHETNSKSYL